MYLGKNIWRNFDGLSNAHRETLGYLKAPHFSPKLPKQPRLTRNRGKQFDRKNVFLSTILRSTSPMGPVKMAKKRPSNASAKAADSNKAGTKATPPKELWFNEGKMTEAKAEYVLWLDGMGIGTSLATSLSHAANFIFKLHRAVGDSIDESSEKSRISLYPLMDGMYITCGSRPTLEKIIRSTMVRLGREFTTQTELTKRFLIRGGLAFGATIHGANLPSECFCPSKSNEDTFNTSTLNETRSRLLLSSGMQAAYESERKAPPFGIYVHESAISVPRLVNVGERGFPSRLWCWWKNGDATAKAVAKQLATQIEAYFNEAEARSIDINYPTEAIRRHRSAFNEYFRDLRNAGPSPSNSGHMENPVAVEDGNRSKETPFGVRKLGPKCDYSENCTENDGSGSD